MEICTVKNVISQNMLNYFISIQYDFLKTITHTQYFIIKNNFFRLKKDIYTFVTTEYFDMKNKKCLN